MAKKMNKKVKKKWLKALRSGEYSQTKEVLSDGAGFCCLGVLCDLAVDEGIAWWDGYGNVTSGKDSEDEGVATVNKTVAKWAGLWDDKKEDFVDIVAIKSAISPNDTNLIHLNDELGYTFEQIADVIEAEL